MTPAQIEEARRWTALRGWRWMRGMICWQTGSIVTGVDPRGRAWIVDDDGDMRVARKGDLVAPDVTDPATQGCLLTLTREITGSHVHVVFVDDDMYRCMRRSRGDDGRWAAYPSSGPTETAALLAACERHEGAS